jgi:hypothetical protein
VALVAVVAGGVETEVVEGVVVAAVAALPEEEAAGFRAKA